ncbi:MAG TPA: 2-C-methyl-D-erythritol 4-phosphate cytidylyltransferase [Puia sp.]|nr:2-C-methyl-D-erythritol 4-phosphate cytidylyltransferase [Puia sp.]
MKKYAVIVAGGSGTRMGSELPKQFLLIHDKPILWYTLHAFLKSYKDINIILVLPPDYYDPGRAICDEINSLYPIQTIVGGTTRFHSVQTGLSLIKEQSVIFVHDGVRCLLSPSLIHLCYEETLRFGSAIPCIDSKDSVRIMSDSGHRAIKRTDVKMVQTPQTFLSDIILPAYQVVYQEAFTDDASVAEAAGHSIHLVEGEEDNIKITTPLDLAIAEELLDPPQLPV